MKTYIGMKAIKAEPILHTNVLRNKDSTIKGLSCL